MVEDIGMGMVEGIVLDVESGMVVVLVDHPSKVLDACQS